MSRYQPVNTGPSPPTTPPRRSSVSILRRPSISAFRFGTQRPPVQLADPEEMDAAFDGPDDDGDGEDRQLLANTTPERPHVPGDYDFERDYTQPPESPPPFQPYSAQNPAPGNTNGLIPSSPAIRPPSQPRHFLGGILPSAILPRSTSPNPAARGTMGAGNTGVFTNLSARPDNQQPEVNRDGPEFVPEDEQKEGPPSYQAAIRDSVPAYWETTVVLPSSSSPFGPLQSSISGDEILIDGMPTGNFFGFVWNVVVSATFQFVGFLLTYVLHTTHAAKYGSRVGLGITLIQFGFNLRSRAQDLIETGRFPTDPSDPDSTHPSGDDEEQEAENAIDAIWGPSGSPFPFAITDPSAPADTPPIVISNLHDAEDFAHAHNSTLGDMFNLPSASDVGRANEYFSFFLMTIGWFLVLTSLGGLWRVKRFEKGLRRAQRESEAAQAAANRGDGEVPVEPVTTSPAADQPGPLTPQYYSRAVLDLYNGAQGIRRGFFGMNGRPLGTGHRLGLPNLFRARGHGHERVPLPHELWDEDVDLQLQPMASEEGEPGRRRGLWGV